MNREIKFRAWNGESILNKPDISDGSSGGEYSSVYINDGIEFCYYDLMQFTGLKDKNGIEIYEGDILIHDDRIKGFVKYVGCSFIIEWIGIDTYSDLLGWDNWKAGKVSDGSNYEIIGNIYQNPELLESVHK